MGQTKATGEAQSRFYSGPDGLSLHLHDYDPGESGRLPLICLCGLTRNADDFAPLAQALAFESATPRRVVAFDYRGRGRSDYDPDWLHYDLATERGDILTGLALTGIETAHWLGTSRGGLHILGMAGDSRPMFRSVIFNDIGPVLEKAGLARIKDYIGVPSAPRDYAEAIAKLKTGPALHFPGLSDAEWRFLAASIYGPDESHLALRYDPALAFTLDSFNLDAPLPAFWPQFDALTGLPVLTIRGETSDLLSPETFAGMGARWPGCETLEVPGQGHAPLLVDTRSIETINAFLAGAD